jgi:hypothetical protein
VSAGLDGRADALHIVATGRDGRADALHIFAPGRGVGAGRPRGRPRGPTNAVMAARRSANDPAIPHYRRPAIADAVFADDHPHLEFEDEDENHFFQDEHIAMIRNPAALNCNRISLAPQNQVHARPELRELPAPEINVPILADVECCICQKQRSNRVTSCVHLYCNDCY